MLSPVTFRSLGGTVEAKLRNLTTRTVRATAGQFAYHAGKELILADIGKAGLQHARDDISFISGPTVQNTEC